MWSVWRCLWLLFPTVFVSPGRNHTALPGWQTPSQSQSCPGSQTLRQKTSVMWHRGCSHIRAERTTPVTSRWDVITSDISSLKCYIDERSLKQLCRSGQIWPWLLTLWPTGVWLTECEIYPHGSGWCWCVWGRPWSRSLAGCESCPGRPRCAPYGLTW